MQRSSGFHMQGYLFPFLSPDGIKCLATFRETLHPVSPEFGKLMEKPVPTHWVSWPAEER